MSAMSNCRHRVAERPPEDLFDPRRGDGRQVEAYRQIGLPQFRRAVGIDHVVFQQISVIQIGLGKPNFSITFTSSSVCSKNVIRTKGYSGVRSWRCQLLAAPGLQGLQVEEKRSSGRDDGGR